MPVDYAASVQGISIRVTRLDVNGSLLTGAMDSYVTNSFIRTSFTPEYEDGDEITEKAADGTVCVSFKAPDTLKRVTMEVAICDPDPELSALLSGGLLLSDVNNEGNEVSLGWASAQVGEDPSGNGVAVEVWSRAIQNGKPAPTNPYFHWVFPYVKTRLSGDRVIENGLLATTFEGFGLGNINFRAGPDGSWRWPAAVDRPYLYARTPWAPQGLRGFYGWSPGATAGDTPVASAPATALPDVAAGNKPGFNVNDGGTIYPKNPASPEDNVLAAADFILGDPTATATYPASAASQDVGNPHPVAAELGVTYKSRGDTAVAPDKGTSSPGDVFPSEPTVTASDATNAAKLAGLGYVATPTTVWTTGQKITIGTFDFSWNGTAWAAGAAP
jgi:hypothetical protein